jgi:hypothetical protein
MNTMGNFLSRLLTLGCFKGGVIGEPNREIVVEPHEEPIPKIAPAPVMPDQPVKAPEPLTPA